MMFLTHALPKLEPNIFLKFDALIRAQVRIPLCVNTKYLFPILELLHGYILHLTNNPLVPRNNLCGILELCQYHLVFLKRQYPKEALRVFHPLINIQRRGDL